MQEKGIHVVGFELRNEPLPTGLVYTRHGVNVMGIDHDGRIRVLGHRDKSTVWWSRFGEGMAGCRCSHCEWLRSVEW